MFSKPVWYPAEGDRHAARCALHRPGAGRRHSGAQPKFFMPHFVFDVVPTHGEVEFFQIGPTPQKSSVLVGSLPRTPRHGTRGSETRCLRSETARVPPLLVYESYTACEELIKTGATSAKPIARSSAAGRRAWMPWPIAETRTFTFNGKSHEILRLQFLGINKGNFEPAAPSPGEAQAVYSEGEVADIKGNVRRLDLVFVIDTTLSMTPAIASTIAAVELICQQLHDLPFQPDLNFGLVEYRDFVNAIMFKKGGKLSPVKVYPLQGDLNAFLATIRQLKATTDSSEDWPEAVFDGVRAALQQTAWRGDRLSARAIILIGDNSGHEPGHPKNPDNIGAEDLVNLARDRQTNVKLFSLCIEGDGGEEEQALHKAQFTKLAEGTGGKCYSFREAVKVVNKIRAILESETATVHKRSSWFRRARRRGRLLRRS